MPAFYSSFLVFLVLKLLPIADNDAFYGLHCSLLPLPNWAQCSSWAVFHSVLYVALQSSVCLYIRALLLELIFDPRLRQTEASEVVFKVQVQVQLPSSTALTQ